MSSNEIIKIIEILPQYIQYIFPGYLTIYLYLFFRSLTMKDNKGTIAKSIAISYVYMVILREFIEPLIKTIFNGDSLSFFIKYKLFFEVIILIIMSMIVSYLAYAIISCNLIQNHLFNIGIRTSVATNEIEQFEYESNGKSVWVCVYLKNSKIVYEGFIVNREMEPEQRMFLCLGNFRKYIIDENGKPVHPYIEEHDDEPEEKVIIYYPEISIIEKRKTE